MICASWHKKLRVWAALFLLFSLAACRETPALPATADEEKQDADYLVQLHSTDAINAVTAASDDSGAVEQTDYNRTIGRTSHKDYWRNREFRLNMVAKRILIAAYPLCPHEFRSRSMMVGIAMRSRAQPEVEWAITPFGKLDHETLKLGDEIIAMGDQEIKPGITGSLTARGILSDYANRMQPLRFYIKRVNKEGEKLYFHVTQQPYNYCNYPVVMDSGAFNADATSDNKIHFTGTAVSALSTDDELGFVAGHETAHLVMGHLDKRAAIRVLTIVGEIFAWNSTGGGSSLGQPLAEDNFNRDFESEADYVGIYLAAKAGYDPAGALAAMETIAELNPDYIRSAGLFGDHPATAARYTQLRKAVEQIKQKQAEGLPLMPDFDE